MAGNILHFQCQTGTLTDMTAQQVGKYECVPDWRGTLVHQETFFKSKVSRDSWKQGARLPQILI